MPGESLDETDAEDTGTVQQLQQVEDSLTEEQRAAVFGSTAAPGRQVSPNTKRRAVCSA